MRIAVVSDVHGNLTAFEAVLADLRHMAPDQIVHAGDLADAGANPVLLIDQIRDLGWQGVVGNTDELLFRPASLTEFGGQSPPLVSMFFKIEEMACATRERLGQDRLDWLRALPRTLVEGAALIVHAQPNDLWRAPGPEAGDGDFSAAYESVHQQVIVYGHIHRPFIRKAGPATIVNSGSVGLPYDGDPRASYVLLDDGMPVIRRVEYDIDKEVSSVRNSNLPHSAWIERMLRSATAQMP